MRPINFSDPQPPLRRPAPDRVEWASITTGNFAGTDLVLSDGVTRLAVRILRATFDRAIAELGAEPGVVERGGFARQLRLSRFPRQLTVASAELDQTAPSREGGTPPRVCVLMKDGHQTWSSPVYLVRGSDGP